MGFLTKNTIVDIFLIILQSSIHHTMNSISAKLYNDTTIFSTSIRLTNMRIELIIHVYVYYHPKWVLLKKNTIVDIIFK